MHRFLALALLLCMFALIGLRAVRLRGQNIKVYQSDRGNRDLALVIPLLFCLLLLVIGQTFAWPGFGRSLFDTTYTRSMGLVCCVAGLSLIGLALRAFGLSFRIGIDLEQPGALVTHGIFAYSRNPIYLGMLLMLLGQFLVFGTWPLLLFLLGAFLVIQQRIKREEQALTELYGQEYLGYQRRVSRYF